MKNLASILILVLAITFTTQAQKERKQKKPKFTVEQQATLAIKKMTLALGLSEKQQNQIKPLLMAQITDKKANMQKRKAARKSGIQPTAEEIYALKNKQLDKQIVMNNKMKDILNKDQFEKFQKMQHKRKMAAKKKMKNKKEMMLRKRKNRKNIEEGK